MSLEAQLEALNKNVLALIGVMSDVAAKLTGSPAVVKAGHADPAVIKSAEKAIESRAAQAPAAPQEPASTPATYAMVKAQFNALALSKGRDVAVATLAELGYPNGIKPLETSGTPEQLAPILEGLKKAAA